MLKVIDQVDMVVGYRVGRSIPFWRLYLADNPLGDQAGMHLAELEKAGVRLNLEYNR